MSFGIRRILLLLFSFVKYLYYIPSDFLLKSDPTEKKDIKSLLIIKLDEIGDYIVFRNFIKIIRQSKVFKGYKISLMGNDVWKEIAEVFDNDIIDSFNWLNKKKYEKKLFYRRKFLGRVNKTNFGVVINFNISRKFFLDDAIVKVVNASRKIGYETDLANTFNWQRSISDNYYSELINVKDVTFEFTKHKKLLESFLSEQINLKVPHLDTKILSNDKVIKEDYIVLFMGSKRNYLRWAVWNFKIVAEYIIIKYNYKIVLIGAASDITYAKKFKSLINLSLCPDIIDFTAKSKLTETIKLISNAVLTISNDSGMAHISAATGTNTIVLLNGSRFGRFFPYPVHSTLNVFPLYPEGIDNINLKFHEFANRYKYRSRLNINSISPERVMSEISKILRL